MDNAKFLRTYGIERSTYRDDNGYNYRSSQLFNTLQYVAKD